MSWYRGSLPKEQVIRIVIVPEMEMGSSAEAWHSDELQADCCLQDGQLFLCGSCIPILPGLFSGFVFVQEIQGLECLDCSKTEDLSDLFHGCAFLRQLNLKAWNTGKVRNFQNCFRGCTLLKEVDLSTWDLSSAKNLSGMFMECSSLEKLDLEQWNTERVRDLSFCFAHCKKLRNLSLSSWNTAAIRQADSLFEGCLSANSGCITVESAAGGKFESHVHGLQCFGTVVSRAVDVSESQKSVVDVQWLLKAETTETIQVEMYCSGGFKRPV